MVPWIYVLCMAVNTLYNIFDIPYLFSLIVTLTVHYDN